MTPKSLYKFLKPPRGFRLTKTGWIFFAFLLAIIVVSMATGNNLLFLILAGLLAFMIVSGMESELNIRHLQLTRSLPPEIYAGMPVMVSYTVRNPRRSSSRLVLVDEGSRKLPAITRGFPEAVRSERVFRKRGASRLQGASISTTYPYGLFAKSISFDLEDEVIVFPGPVPCEHLAAFGPSGGSKGTARDSISHVRAYAPGDPLSSIVWKKQHMGLISRVVQGGGGVGAVIVLHPGGDLEQKLGMACFLVLELMSSGLSFGLSVNGFYSGMGRSADHKLRILAELALIENLAEPEHREFPGEAHAVHL